MKRFEWLAQMINERGYKRSIELGVRDGVTSKHLLENCPGLRYHLMIDMWAPQPSNKGPETYVDMSHVANLAKVRLLKDRFPDRAFISQKHTVAAAKTFPDNAVDIVFVDADHGYDAVMADIQAWGRKVRAGGILCGHDYDWSTVKMAVNDTLVRRGFDINIGGERGTNIWWIEVGENGLR